jgi:hypothetical protein
MDKYDTLEYSWIKAITVSMHLWNFLCTLINTNNVLLVELKFGILRAR